MSSVRCAPWLVVLALATAACGQAAGGSRPLTPSDWVQRGIEQFRAATAVDVDPGADGEGFCGNVQPICRGYTLTQTSSTAPPSAAMPCRSIPACAIVFFNPMVTKLDFEDAGVAGVVAVDGESDSCMGWCVWRMEFDRTTGNIVAVDIYLRGGSHQVWPTYAFGNYVVGGRAFETPTPAPPRSTVTAAVVITGDVRLSAAQVAGACMSNGTSPGATFLVFDSSARAAAAPVLRSLAVDFDPIAASVTAQTTVEIYPGDPAQSSTTTIEYKGGLTSTAVGGDPLVSQAHRDSSGNRLQRPDHAQRDVRLRLSALHPCASRPRQHHTAEPFVAGSPAFDWPASQAYNSLGELDEMSGRSRRGPQIPFTHVHDAIFRLVFERQQAAQILGGISAVRSNFAKETNGVEMILRSRTPAQRRTTSGVAGSDPRQHRQGSSRISILDGIAGVDDEFGHGQEALCV